MGLTNKSTGSKVISNDIDFLKFDKNSKVIALAGNPNVGKSTVFNELTGMNQHTGNWPGKTVTSARGEYTFNNKNFTLVDIPGTYSLMSNSPEEEIARDFICFCNPDTTIVVMDATCMERNLNLVLQVLEVTSNVVVCVNLLDEAKKKKINIDLNKLSCKLGVPVIGTSARNRVGLKELQQAIYDVSIHNSVDNSFKIKYDENIENAINRIVEKIKDKLDDKINPRFVSIKLLDLDDSMHKSLTEYLGFDILDNDLDKEINLIKKDLEKVGIKSHLLRDKIVTEIVRNSEKIYNECVNIENKKYNSRDRKIDKILTSKTTGIPIMIILFAFVFWLTIVGANYPSELLSNMFSYIETKLLILFNLINAPNWLTGVLVLGMYKTVTWVIAVMLPPMAIFFPLFTLLEDSGFLPRIAFNLDKFFKKANAHGKQALTMIMGIGCNACGVVGCRIIDSPRERLIAILTNNFVPCNGRYPTLISIITMFLSSAIIGGFMGSIISTLLLTALILLGVIITLFVSKLLSKTILKGIPSSFALELPPYRKPQIGKVLVRSIFDRTLFVLGRAIAVAAPAGIIIWLMANINISGSSLLSYCTNFLDPFGKIIGLDGVIIMAFILGFPANEIVIPIIIMSYMATGNIMELNNLSALRELLINNGWTITTAICMMLFCLFHFPCGTTCLTIKKETGSFKWTLISFLLPTIIGIILCFIVSMISKIFILI
ncbi:MAG: ferrous iron transport protein B [Firmicutes bacterium]|nr:ferrous iron transport protein B [Bacillota bacterium]